MGLSYRSMALKRQVWTSNVSMLFSLNIKLRLTKPFMFRTDLLWPLVGRLKKLVGFRFRLEMSSSRSGRKNTVGCIIIAGNVPSFPSFQVNNSRYTNLTIRKQPAYVKNQSSALVVKATPSQTLWIPCRTVCRTYAVVELVSMARSLCFDFDCSWMSQSCVCMYVVLLSLHPFTPPLLLSFLSSPWQQETSGRLSRLTRLVDERWQIPMDCRKQEERTFIGDDRLCIRVCVCVFVCVRGVCDHCLQDDGKLSNLCYRNFNYPWCEWSKIRPVVSNGKWVWTATFSKTRFLEPRSCETLTPTKARWTFSASKNNAGICSDVHKDQRRYRTVNLSGGF